MRPKSLALLMLAVGCGLVAMIGTTQWMAHHRADTAGNGKTQPVFVAIADVALGDLLSPQMLKLEQWPADKVPSGALSQIGEIEGRRVRTRLYAGEPILANKLMGKGASEQGATALIPKGYRVVPVRVDLQNSGNNLILPGDRVDVMVYLTRDPGRDIAETGTRTILQDIKVFAVNDVLDLEKEKDPSRSINAKTISLLVTPEQAAKVILAGQMGTIQLVMRSPEDDGRSENAQAKPSELFGNGNGSKAVRAKETLMVPQVDKQPDKGRGIIGFLNSLGAKTKANPASPAKVSDAWTMRIIQPGSVSDVVLQSESLAITSASPFGLWKTTNTVTTATDAKSDPVAPPTKQPTQRSAAAQPPTSAAASADPLAGDTPEAGGDAWDAPLPPSVAKPKSPGTAAPAVPSALGGAAKRLSN